MYSKDIWFECLKANDPNKPEISCNRRESPAGKELVEKWLKEEGFRYQYHKRKDVIAPIGSFHIEWGEVPKIEPEPNPLAVLMALIVIVQVGFLMWVLFS